MRILVLVSAYPNLEGAKSLYYVHSRNLYYNKHKNIEITVLNFQTQQDYIIDGIEVISLLSYIKDKRNFELLICHAANIRNHYIFLKKYGTRFRKKIFFFHGHEILHIEKYYPKPYFYMKKNMARSILQNYYDNIKIFLWTGYQLEDIPIDAYIETILKNVDYLIDGKYIEEERDVTLKWRGSKNQRILTKEKICDIINHKGE